MISSLELAKICGVSQGTVDRALHNRKGVSAQTQKAVLETAARHGYAPNPSARELMTGTSKVVAMLVPRLDRFFLMDIAEIIKRKLHERGLRLILAIASDSNEAVEAVRDFAARRVCAVIIIPPVKNFKIQANLFDNTPVISLLDRCRGAKTLFVHPNEASTGRHATEYLAKKGHTTAIHLTYTRDSWAVKTRTESFQKRAVELGMRVSVMRGFDSAGLIGELNISKATSLFCHNDWLAFQAFMHLEKAGKRVPDNVAIVGVDNSPSFNEFCGDLTTFEYPFEWTASEVAAIADCGKPSGKPCPDFRLMERRT